MLIYAAMAVVGGLGVGVLLVVLLQLLERGLETSDAIEGTLGLATLASIPDARPLPGYRKSGLPAPPAELLLKRPQPPYAAAFRTLRTSLQFAAAATPVRLVAITWAVDRKAAGQGKAGVGRVDE